MDEIQNLRSQNLLPTLNLNNAHAKETSLLDIASLSALVAMAFYARGFDGGAGALLIAMDQNAAYDNPNFNWFKQRRGRFVYIDRVIVSEATRGQGLARRMYQDLFAYAVQCGHDRVVCEINLAPPNPASDAFHASMGFAEIGQASIHGGAKTVRYFEKALS